MIQAFRRQYGSVEGLRIFRAPGRVNLIGEHTDYSLGFVLPVALELATYVATAPNADGMLRMYSEDRQELGEWPIADLAALKPSKHWTDYPLGVARELIDAGFPLAPANLLIRSTVPDGGGLSSSAALEISTALALLLGRPLGATELAKLGQRAEHRFVGNPCGIMDQYISVFGREHAAVEIDCRSLEHRLVQLPAGVTFLAVNTMVKHALSGSAYRDRVAECAAAVEGLRRHYPEAKTLRDITVEQFEPVAHELPPVVERRARHVVTEDARVHAFVDASARGDLAAMGRLLVESHRSLQHDYEVSCEELDFLVDRALEIEGVIGSRMTGGGFGGCTVTMVREGSAGAFTAKIAEAYEAKYRLTPRVYPCKPSAGAGEVADFGTVPAKA
jgi:galactokinase